ncbi:MAG: TonB-dependent receptor plug domain-containing protein, partial [Cyclobacteriaceae bacterium]
MKKTLLICFSLMLTFSTGLWAQGRTVTGQVLSGDDEESLPGVNVVIKGTSTGTVTDVDGNFRLEVPSNESVLQISSIGFAPQEIVVGSQSVINVTLMADVTLLGEVVITGLGGDIDKRRLATTVNQVSAEDLKTTPIVRIDQLLQSKLPNTQILQSTGAPGGTSIIRGRGINSALLGQQPVVYIDGVRVDNLNTAPGLSVATGGAQSSALADIPVDQISDVTFLKGGAATTLYGSDAANGVLLITTNKGKAGKAQVTFEAQLGAIDGTGDYFVFDEVKELGFRTGFLGSYRVGVTGGSDKVTYNFFSRFREDNSFQPGQGENRYSIGGGYNASISDRVNYQGSFSYNSNNFTRLPNAN